MAKFKTTYKVPPKSKEITRIAIVIDESGSMGHLRSEVVSAFNRQLEDIKRESARTGQETYISLYTFSYTTSIKKHIDQLPVEQVLSWDADGYSPGGQTALASAIQFAYNDLWAVTGTKDANLVIVITDGQENNSPPSVLREVPQRLRELNKTDRWTFAFLGPVGSRLELQRVFGALPGNVTEWEQTAQGVQDYSKVLASSVQGYYNQRSLGLRSMVDFFTPDLSGVTKADINKKLDDLTSDFKKIAVDKEKPIKDLVEEKIGFYPLGAAYYELTKKELIQPHKSLLLMERKSSKVYGGDVRGFLGMPNNGTDVKIEPGNHGDYRIFVQSTSVNRKLVRGTSVLVVKPVATLHPGKR